MARKTRANFHRHSKSRDTLRLLSCDLYFRASLAPAVQGCESQFLVKYLRFCIYTCKTFVRSDKHMLQHNLQLTMISNTFMLCNSARTMYLEVNFICFYVHFADLSDSFMPLDILLMPFGTHFCTFHYQGL